MTPKTYNPDQLNSLLESESKTLLFIYGAFCSPCKQFKPIVEEVSQELGILTHYIDGPENRDFSIGLGVKKIPTLVLVNQGKVVSKNTGVMSVNELKNFLNQ